jgi:cell division protein FtsI/penicillin-binding protein 2
MNREQLKTLINEAIKEVLNEKTSMRKIHKDTKVKKNTVKEQEGDSTDGGEEKTQEIQLTLDRETAQKLHDLLMAQLATSNDTEGGDVQPVAQDMDSDQLPAEDEEEAA